MTAEGNPFARLPGSLMDSGVDPWGELLATQAEAALANNGHGDLPGWLRVIEQLPGVASSIRLNRPMPELGGLAGEPEMLRQQLMALHPWRKGPLALGGEAIDTEWRSDWKWDRLAPHIELAGETILDIGCGNGYFGLRMLGAGAKCVVGVDPTLVFVMQWLAQRHFAPGLNNFVLPLKDTDLPAGLTGFDRVFSMGVLYHRRNPPDHLGLLHSWLRPGGRLVLETLVLDQPGEVCLVPPERYARMRNVWYLPSTDLAIRALSESGFRSIELLDVATTTVKEQRTTPWMQFESLAESLDPKDSSRTIEGHPAPVRAVLTAVK